MTSRAWLHIGLPKTGTTFLQTVAWQNRDRLLEQGVLLPGRERRDHLWASRHWRDQPGPEAETSSWHAAWTRIAQDLAAWDGDAVISHEFFCAASTEQARALVAALAPAEVHLVVTAREPVSLFTSSWQESLKNRHVASFAAYSAAPVSENTTAIWNWRSLDLRLVLERWAPAFEPDRVHILPLPVADAPPELLWERFAGLLGVDAASFDLSRAEPNQSLGVVEAETLRRINTQLPRGAFTAAFDRGVYLRSLLADRYLATREGERFWPDPATVADCRARADAAVRLITRAGYDVIGDVADLVPPEQLAERRSVEDVDDAEVAEVAAALSGDLLLEIRRLTQQRNRLRTELRQARADASLRRILTRRCRRRRTPVD